jgi:hypothetical protein
VTCGIFSVGFLLLTLMVKVAVEISMGSFTVESGAGSAAPAPVNSSS